MKTIYKTRLTANFTTLPNAMLRDKSLSFRARGVLAMVLSNSEEWEVTQAWLREQGTEGEQAIQKSVRELEMAGYAVFAEERNEAGKFKCAVWTFHDSPVTESLRTKATAPRHKEPPTENPLRHNPVSGLPVGGNPPPKKDYVAEGLSEETSAPEARADGELQSQKPETSFHRRFTDAGVKGIGGIDEPTLNDGTEKKGKFHADFIGAWCSEFQALRSEKYDVCGGKDGAAVKRLGSTGRTVDELIATAKAAWTRKAAPNWHCQKAVSISYFAGFLNEIRAELAAPSQQARHNGTPAPTGETLKSRSMKF